MNKHRLLISGILALFLLGISNFAFGAPRYGGILKMVTAAGPQMLSYEPAMGPGDHSHVFPGGERLANTTGEKGVGIGVEPVLAERFEESKENKTITWYLHKGVKFHDGTEMTAEVVKWNFQQILDAKALPYANHLKRMVVKDKYTLVMELNSYNNQCLPAWGFWPVITSKAAWDKASGGDLNKGKEWARTHIVGTGPFVLKEFKRDVSMTWVKNKNYWREGRPYLDGIEVRYIPDTVTASAMLMAGEADYWNGTPAKERQTLEMQGYKNQSDWPALGYVLWLNTATGEKWQDKKLREAVEYAINKDALTKAVGFGQFRALNSLPPKGEWGYDPNYNPRPFNPDKAKALLFEAGYKKGLPIKLMVESSSTLSKDTGIAVKQYLESVGFKVNLDLADPGRFYGSILFVKPAPEMDMVLWFTGRDSNYLMSYYRWFSTQPFSDVSLLGHTPEQAALDKAGSMMDDLKEQEIWAKILTHYITDNALVIPLYDSPVGSMHQKYVHSTQYTQGFTRFQYGEVWMDKH